MAKLAFIADIHVGNPASFGGPTICGVNTRGRHVLEALQRAVTAAQDFDGLVICGDLFDTANPSPQLISEVQSILAQGPRTYLLMGNHDMVSDAPGDNALGPLQVLDNVLIIEQPSLDHVGDCMLISIPFRAGDCREWFEDAVAHRMQEVKETGLDTADYPVVLAFHLGVVDSDTPAFLANAHDAIPLEMLQRIMDEHGIDYAFCGNWHNYKRWVGGPRVTQCGALAPTGWDNPGWDYGKVITLNTIIKYSTEIDIPGPRFLSVDSMEAAEVAKIEAARRNCQLYLSLKGAAADCLDDVRAMGINAKAVADTAGAKDATRTAAKAVKEASTLQEALARFVNEMPLTEGMNRQRVQALASRYLAGGGHRQ